MRIKNSLIGLCDKCTNKDSAKFENGTSINICTVWNIKLDCQATECSQYYPRSEYSFSNTFCLDRHTLQEYIKKSCEPILIDIKKDDEKGSGAYA